MKAGITKLKITPPVGVDQSGYVGRPGPSARIHDDLYAVATVLDDGATRALILTLDILGATFEQDAALRKSISDATGIPQPNILIACSHTHAGPAIQHLRECGTPDDAYVRWAFAQAKAAAVEANKELADAELSFVRAKSDLAFNRRDWVIDQKVQQSQTSGVITDPEVSALRVETSAGRSVMLFNYACHGVVLGNQNLEISADWIGVAKSMLEQSANVEAAAFLQGCCGNINPRIRGSFEDVKHAGETVANPLLAALADASPVDSSKIKIAWRTVELPYGELPPQEEIEMEVSFRREEVERRRAEGAPKVALQVDNAMLGWAKDALRMLDSGGGPKSVSIRLQAISLGGLNLVSIPGEVFCEMGLAVKKMCSTPTMVVGYANGNIGYVPTEEAYKEGGYEVDGAYKYYGTQMIGPESEEIILEAAESLLAEVQ